MSIYQLSVYCIAMALVLLLSGCAKPARSAAPEETNAPAVIQVVTEPEKREAEIPPENQEVQTLVEEFARLYFEKNREEMKAYLTSDYGSLIDAYPMETDAVRVHACKLPQSVTYELAAKGRCWASVEFYETPESDSYTYLSITLVMEDDQWKIQSYGLEA